MDAAARVRDQNFKCPSEDKGATVIARLGAAGITICDPNCTDEAADKLSQRIYERAI